MSLRLLVADSGPLIALARLGLLALPRQLFAEVLVTATVWDEVTGAPERSEHADLLVARQQGWLAVVEDPSVVPAVFNDPRLDDGERSALALSLARDCDVLIDERRGRLVAEAAGLNVVGTLGLLVRARQLGLVGPVRPLAERLLHSGYHLSQALVDRALVALGE